MKKYNTTHLIYRKYVFMYGLVSTLMVLDYFEEEENFEECEKIIKALIEQEVRLDCSLYKRICKQAVDELSTAWKLDIETTLYHCRYYSSLIIQELDEKHLIKCV